MALSQVSIEAKRTNPRRIEFNLWTNHLQNLYMRMLDKTPTGRVRKIIIWLHEGESEEFEPLKDSDIDSNTWHFDFEAFWKADVLERKKMLADAIRDRLVEVAKGHGWDTQPFKDAHKQVVSAGYMNEESGAKQYKSPDGKWLARWHYVFDHDRIEYSLIVTAVDGTETRRLPLYQTEPMELYLSGAAGKLVWLSDTRVALLAKDGTQQGVVDIEKPPSKPKKKK